MNRLMLTGPGFEIPHKLKFFTWLALRQRLVTNDFRYRRGLADSPICARCGESVETVLHLLRDCQQARALWNSMAVHTLPPFFFTTGLDDWNSFFSHQRLAG